MHTEETAILLLTQILLPDVSTETLNAYKDEIQEAVDELFAAAFKNQSVDNDLLIVIIHGYYDVTNLEFHKRKKLPFACSYTNEQTMVIL